MSRKTERTDVDALSELPEAELDRRLSATLERVESRSRRAQADERDLSERESALTAEDISEMSAIRDAIELRSRNEEHRERAVSAISAAVETRSQPWRPTLRVSDEHLAQHAEALRGERPHGTTVEIETRARLTTAGDLGSAGAWAAGQPNEPRHLISFAAIPVSELAGRTAQIPAYTGPAAAAGVDESTAHPEYDAIAPVTLTALRYGRWSEVSALADAVDDLRGIQQMQSWGIARDLDLLAVAAIETAASTPAALVDLDQQVREAILTVAAATYSDESSLVVFGTAADLSLLTGTTPANSDDLGSVPVRYHGARLYPTTAATADQLTVFAPNAFRVFQARLRSATLIDPENGSHKFGSWLHSTPVAQQIVGAAAAVATAAE